MLKLNGELSIEGPAAHTSHFCEENYASVNTIGIGYLETRAKAGDLLYN